MQVTGLQRMAEAALVIERERQNERKRAGQRKAEWAQSAPQPQRVRAAVQGEAEDSIENKPGDPKCGGVFAGQGGPRARSREQVAAVPPIPSPTSPEGVEGGEEEHCRGLMAHEKKRVTERQGAERVSGGQRVRDRGSDEGPQKAPEPDENRQRGQGGE